MKTGRLTEIQGYVPYTKSERWERENAAYLNTKAFIAVNVILMISVVVITGLLARRVFSSPHVLMRWLAGSAIIGAGLFGLVLAYFIADGIFYDGTARSVPKPGGPWVEEYNRGMTFLVAGKLLGHAPEEAWHSLLDDDVRLLANKEMLLLTDVRDDVYLLVPAPGVQLVRKMTKEEIQSAHSIEYDPDADILSLISGEPSKLPLHESGVWGRGPFEIKLNTRHPRAIWILRANAKETMSNEDFLSRLMDTLHPEAGTPK